MVAFVYRQATYYCPDCRQNQIFIGIELDPEQLLRCRVCGLIVSDKLKQRKPKTDADR